MKYLKNKENTKDIVIGTLFFPTNMKGRVFHVDST